MLGMLGTRARPHAASTLALGASLCLSLGVGGCRGGGGSADPDAGSSAGDGREQTIGPRVDAAAMFATIELLADDALEGRFTLDPKIEEAASWIAAQHQGLGLEPAPGAESMRVAYTLLTEVEPGEAQALTIHGSKGAKAVGPDRFVSRPEGQAGRARGEVVFAGYAARWDRSEQPEFPAMDGGEAVAMPSLERYDDLEGLELAGKVALILDSAPNTPDLSALFMAMQGVSEDFDEKVGALREADDLAGLEALHKQARERFVALVSAYIDVSKLGDAYWKVEDPRANFDFNGAAMQIMAQAMANPQFAPGEHTLPKKLERLAAAGAVGAIVVKGPRSEPNPEAREADRLGPGADAEAGAKMSNHAQVLPEPGPIPLVQLSWREADRRFDLGGERLSEMQAAIDGDYQPRSMALGVEAEFETALKETRVEVPNVVAMIPGKTDELVVLGAHFDHIGTDESGDCRAVVRPGEEPDGICNGADDNASGTAMILDLARAISESIEATGERPQRTLIFTHFSGEELGLLGSRALAANAPFDMGKVVAMVNLDMVGRLGPQGLAIGGIYSSDEWMPLLDEVGNHGMRILYEGGTTTRSDHAWWFRRQTPVLFFFTGVHPDYHRAGDEIDEIDVEGLQSIGQLVSDVVWRLAGGYALKWGALGPDEGVGRGLPGDDEASIVKVVGADGQVL